MSNSRPYRIRTLLQWIAKFFGKKNPGRKPEPESPADPYAYVMAPKKPRPSGRGAAAVAEWPEE